MNVVVSSDSAEGASSAPAAPWNARAVTSIPKLCAAPPIADTTPNATRPVMSTRLRPNRSPKRPNRSSRLPNVSEYAVMTHCRLALEKPSAFCADGSAMFTTVASSTTISWAVPSSARISQRRS